MKKIAQIIASLSLSLLIMQVSLAQEQSENKIKDREAYDKNEKDMSSEDNKKMDKDVTQKAQQDLATRYPDVDDAVVTWDRSDRGYHAIYRTDAGDYMALYDGNGNWVETMKKSNWDDSVPDYVKSGINENTSYKGYKVDSYWEVYESNANAKGYYFNLKNNEGKYKNLRMNEEGKVIDNTDY